MRFYQDVVQTKEPRESLAAIGDLLRACAGSRDPQPGVRSRWIDALREALIQAGMLEQSIADGIPGSGPGAGVACRSRRLTQAIGQALAAAWDGRQPACDRPLKTADVLACELAALGPLPATVPEGYLFYGLFPELYELLGHAIGCSLAPGTPFLVAGVRSIGTSLSAMLAEGLRATGHRSLRITVRPSGDPFARDVTLPPAEAGRARGAARRGAYAVAVDEGPGLSGSSLAATISALQAHGFAADHVIIACANPPAALPHAAPAIRRIWETTRWYAAREREGEWWQQRLPAVLGDALGSHADLQADLSWGGWRAYRHGMHDEPLALPGLERRKLLLRSGGGQVMVKFAGFTQIGSRKARLTNALAAAGFTPPVLGFAHGMLAQRWLPDAAPCHEPPIVVAAAYYAYLRRACRTGEVRTLRDAMEPPAEVVRAWFGSRLDAQMARLQASAGRILVQQMDGDEKPERNEWLMDRGEIRKVDVADHFIDHSWARTQDSAFDLAGFSQEFGLSPAQETLLLEHYSRSCDDGEPRERLPYYHVLYAAHRLAALDTAYHAAGSEPAAHIDVERRRYAATLERKLVEYAAQCAC